MPVCGFGALTVTRSNVTITDCRFQDNRAYGSIEPSVASGATFIDCATSIEGASFERHGNTGAVIVRSSCGHRAVLMRSSRVQRAGG